MAYSAKRSFSYLQDTKMRCPREIFEDDDGPMKKKLKKNLAEIFNRASMCVNASEDHMNVFLRIKPFTSEDSIEENQGCLRIDETEQSVIASAPDQSHTHKSSKRGLGKSEHRFTFSRIFNENTSQAQFFNDTMLSMTKEFISGQNSLVFTYGVTSSGKTYTIQGKPQDAGILPRSLDVLFNSINGKQIKGLKFKPRRFTDVVKLTHEEESSELKIKEKVLKMSSEEDQTVSALLGDETEVLSCTMASTCSSASQDESLPDIESRVREELKVDVDDNGKFNFSVWISFAEIYNEQIFDLLERIPQKKSCKRTTLKIADDQNGSPYIKGLKEIHVESADEAYRLLTIGKRNLQTASTRLNHCSSRSHCIFTIKVIRVVVKDDPNIARVSMLSFCDLAGSERYSKTQATGDRLKEAGNINTSLLTLGRCIEILRFNQVHRDTSKVVPFRDSKLTRLFTNFFNGSGRAAMIVNVSQCASMFDETLQVFKFSAIAKQVKYLQKPVEPPKSKKKKLTAPLPRPSIPWEAESSKVLLEDASNEPLPGADSEEDSSMDDSMDVEQIMANKSHEELIQTIKFLIDKNTKLSVQLEEEMINASNTEMRVRREVCETMKKQQVLIEKEYSKMLEESEEEAREAMDERVQKVIDLYEKKLARIQRKVDDDDEWVSSLLFFQEERKVKERDEKIAELEKMLEEKGTTNSNMDVEKDEKIEKLEEYIADLRCLHHSSEKEKAEKIEELESYIQEAGDVYKENMEQIATLRKEVAAFTEEIVAKDKNLVKMEKKHLDLEELYRKNLSDVENCKNEASADCTETESKVAQLESLVKDLETKVVNKDTTIKSLEEECEQMQGEIERLQDQMSQMGDTSKRSDLESTAGIDEKSEVNNCDTSMQVDLLNVEEVEALREQSKLVETEREKNRNLEQQLKDQDNKEISLVSEIDLLKQAVEDEKSESAKKTGCLEEELEAQKERFGALEEQLKGLEDEKTSLLSEIDNLKQTVQDDKSKSTAQEEELRERNGVLEKQLKDLDDEKLSLFSEIDSLKQTATNFEDEISHLTVQAERLKEVENECKQLKEENENLNREIIVLQKELKSNVVKDGCTPTQASAHSTMITDMVKELETRATPCKRLKTSTTDIDEEIVFNLNKRSVPEQHEHSDSQSSVNSSAVLLKDAELTISQLKNQLKTEEQDFCQREQALINGYNAEIDNLKQELFKVKTSIGKTEDSRQDKPCKNASVSSTHDDMEVTCDSDSGDKCSNRMLASEVVSLREQLLSSREAYRKLQSQVGESQSSPVGDDTKNFFKRQSIQHVFNQDMSITDSVLQFEMTEYAIEMDVLRNKIKDLSQKIQTKDESLLEAEKKIDDLKEELILSESEKASLQVRLESELTKISSCENDLSAMQERYESYQKTVRQGESSLGEIRKELEVSAQSNADMKEAIQQLENEKSRMQDEMSEMIAAMEEKTAALTVAESTISGLRRELELLEESRAKLSKQFENTSKDNSTLLTDARKELQDVLIVNSKLTVEKESLEKLVSEREEKLSHISDKLETLQTEFATKDKQLLEVQFHLDKEKGDRSEMVETLDKMKQDHQQESAEVSQKLILLEKEKRMAERKLNEIKGKEHEWQMKYQAQDKMKELEQQLQDQLKTTRESLKKHSSKNSELSTELGQQRTENTLLVEERDRLKNELEIQQLHSGKLDEEIATLKQEAKQAQKRNEELMDSLDDLKTGLQQSDKMAEDQERFILVQDKEVNALKSKLEDIDTEKDSLSKQLLDKEEEIAALRVRKELNQEKAITFEEKLQRADSEKSDIEARMKKMKSENESLEEELEKRVSRAKKDRKEIEDLQEEIRESKLDAQKLKDTIRTLESDLEKAAATNSQEDLKEDIKLMKQKQESDSTEIASLREEVTKGKEILAAREKELGELTSQLETLNQNFKKCEKDLAKHQSINRRNKEEMEEWQKEKDKCLASFEQALKKAVEEKKDLTEENAKLKQDNADMVKQANTSQCAKDKVIDDLRKNNNTLSIELASVQGMSPPPKIDTPDRGFPNRIEFAEDNAADTDGHLEIDATPPVALKKGKKRHASKRNIAAVLPEETFTPTRKSLKTIEETNEQSPCSSDNSMKPIPSITSDLASEVFATLSPMTRSGRLQGKQKQKKNPPVTGMLNLESQDENELPMSTRRSSRLRTRSSCKQSVV